VFAVAWVALQACGGAENPAPQAVLAPISSVAPAENPTPKDAPVAPSTALSARPEPTSDIPFAVGIRDPRPSVSHQRVLPLIITEIQQLEALLKSTHVSSPDRPAMLRRLAEDYVELQNAAFRDEARRTTMIAARKHAIDYYTLLTTEYAGDPSATFPSNPPASYPNLDEVYYYLAYAYEQAADTANARRVYLQLIVKQPNSKYVPYAYLSFGELFFAEAKADPSRWEFAKQAYLRVVTSPPPRNSVYAYAWYKLGLVYSNTGDAPHAEDGFQKAADAAAEFQNLPEAARVGGAARAELARVTRERTGPLAPVP
jgi:tetratricopeptide (TPR) repeat protein